MEDSKKTKKSAIALDGIIFFLMVATIFAFVASYVKHIKTHRVDVDTTIEEVNNNIKYELFDKIEIVKIDKNGFIHFHDKDDNHLYMIQKKITIQILSEEYKGE